jgi:two-component system, NtrC family, nitrogen regulation sensor histidine kinase NtrY
MTDPGNEGPGWWERLGYERRILLLTLLAGLPGVVVALALLWRGPYAPRWQVTLTLLVVTGWGGFSLAVRERVRRPLQTLANMLAALRQGDFSIRARVTGGRDPLALAFMEVNALEETLRDQRLGAMEATTLLQKMLAEIDVAVFLFDETDRLRLVNRSGERLLGQPGSRILGKGAGELRLGETLEGEAPRTLDISFPGGQGRWELRRNLVRQEGLPWRLVVLSDLSRALREEERQAWQRLVRVLSHEINNSLAPIKSIAGSLQGLLAREDRLPDLEEDLARGLQVISGRAEGLGRFMQSYARLARLPRPELAPVGVEGLVRRVASLETRLPVDVVPGADLVIRADADQLEQLLINLVRNAVDAVLPGEGRVRIRWLRRGGDLELFVEDEGPGIGETKNLFVPFFTTKPGGTGIGLVLSRQIAEGHGGTLALENRPGGRGARARLTLPMDPRS